MKKISYLELSSLVITIIISFNLGINLYFLKNNSGIDSWITIIITYIIGLIPLFITLYINSYETNLNIFEKNINLFGIHIGRLINLIISLILFIIGITLIYNVTSFITIEFLYHTPMLITSILLISLSVYASNKGINVISHVSLILMTINLIVFILSTTSLIKEIHLDYLLPILKTSKENILTTSIKLAIINTTPLIIISIIPKNNITNPNKYNKSIIIAYLIGALISFIITTTTITTLNIYLTKTFEHSEYIALKKIKLFGFLERVENIISIKWITETFIYLSLIIYTIPQSLIYKKIDTKEELNYHKIDKNKNKFIYVNVITSIIIIITSHYIFPSITTFNNYLEKIFTNIISILIPIYLIITIKIIIKKTLKSN